MYFQLMAAIFDFRHTHTSNNISTSVSVLPDPKNMGIVVGISLPSYIQVFGISQHNWTNENFA